MAAIVEVAPRFVIVFVAIIAPLLQSPERLG